MRGRPLPDALGESFRVADALAAGVGRGRLRGRDLERPFHGIRSLPAAPPAPGLSPYERRRAEVVSRARAYQPRLRDDQFLSHQTAAVLWGAPVPLADASIHVCVLGRGNLPDRAGVVGHRVRERMATLHEHDGLPLSSPATTRAMLGALPHRGVGTAAPADVDQVPAYRHSTTFRPRSNAAPHKSA